jgi:hypothetical protein
VRLLLAIGLYSEYWLVRPVLLVLALTGGWLERLTGAIESVDRLVLGYWLARPVLAGGWDEYSYLLVRSILRIGWPDWLGWFGLVV